MLKLTRADYDEIRRHGEQTYPRECCGILIGMFGDDARTVHSVVRCENACEDSPQSRYFIDPRELIRAQRVAHERGMDVVGFYHSHPDHPAQWSPTDLEDAHWIGCSYVITAIERAEATITKSFVLTGRVEEDKAFAEEELVVEHDGPPDKSD